MEQFLRQLQTIPEAAELIRPLIIEPRSIYKQTRTNTLHFHSFGYKIGSRSRSI